MLRLFIALPVPEEVREKIREFTEEIINRPGLPTGIYFAPEENWHFTLVFLGYQDESAVSAIKKSLENIPAVEAPQVEFEEVSYGPPGQKPRMIWLTTNEQTSVGFGKIADNIANELEDQGVKWRRENRPFQAHLTLARFAPTPAEKLPPIGRTVNLHYRAAEVNLMKSTLRRSGAIYENIFSLKLN